LIISDAAVPQRAQRDSGQVGYGGGLLHGPQRVAWIARLTELGGEHERQVRGASAQCPHDCDRWGYSTNMGDPSRRQMNVNLWRLGWAYSRRRWMRIWFPIVFVGSLVSIALQSLTFWGIGNIPTGLAVASIVGQSLVCLISGLWIIVMRRAQRLGEPPPAPQATPARLARAKRIIRITGGASLALGLAILITAALISWVVLYAIGGALIILGILYELISFRVRIRAND
jgi:hypothetical protein